MQILGTRVSHFFSVKATKPFYFEPAKSLQTTHNPREASVFTANFLRLKILCAVSGQTRKSSESCNVVVRGVQLLVNSAHLYLSTHRFEAVGYL